MNLFKTPVIISPFVLLITSCALLGVESGPTVEQLASTMVAETAAATTAGAEMQEENPTQPPAEQPATSTVAPSPAPTATTGPLSLEDDFSTDTGYWDCDQCEIENGRLRFGPYPVSGAFAQHTVICTACGMVTNYQMSVDVTFGDGPSERGYGLLVRGCEDYWLTFEITPWQDLDFWRYETDSIEWTWVNGIFAGVVRPGRQTNSIEVEVTTSPSGGTDVALSVNGKTPMVIFNQASEPGVVGLTLYGHGVELYFDNFEFKTDESPTFPTNFDLLEG